MALSKKAKKIILIVAAVVVGLPLLAFLIIMLKLNAIVKWGVEAGGSRALGVPVQLQKADVSLLREDVTLAGLNVANPQGFTTPSLVKVGSMHLAANVRALLRDEVHIRDITITDAEFTIEQAGLQTNITALMGQLNRAESAPSAPAEAKPEAKGPEMKLKIDHLLLTGIKVRFVGPGNDETGEMPSFEINDIADGNGNAIPVSKVVQVVLRHVAAKAATAGLDKALEKELKRLGPEGSDVAESVKGEAGKIIGNIFKK